MWGHGWRGQWARTTDGTIPFRLYLFLLGTANVLQAGREVEMVNAVTAGIANAIAGKEDKQVSSSINQLKKAAYPQRFD